MSGKLYLIPSLLFSETYQQVIPPYNVEVIKSLQLFFVENERSARRFISGLKAGVNIEGLRLIVLDKDTLPETIKPVIKEIAAGLNAGVISEAGCPGVADPGALAVGLAHQAGVEVIPLVGPSSILMALMASGMNGQSFAFHGYLPIEKHDRVKAIHKLETESRVKNQTQIFIETPYRNNSLIQDLLNNCQKNTLLCVAADITGPGQFIKTAGIAKWKTEIPDLNKRPAIFLLQGL